uniref:Peptidase S1 domain-containing protein n=1 Tax=Oryza brachyantha TaxID=4533 RepID=J3MQF2_ORYBR
MADLNNNGPRRPNLLTSSVSVNQNWITTTAAHSIFSVEVAVLYEEEDNIETLTNYVELTNALLPPNKRGKTYKKTDVETHKRKDLPKFGQRQQTGFLVEKRGNSMYILTTAHAVDTVYKKGVHQVSAEDLNQVFTFSVICTHQEAYLKQAEPDKSVSELLRSYSSAGVVAVDTQRDLLLLETNENNLRLHDVDDGGFVACSSQHPVIRMSNSPPVQDEPVLMQGWPPLRVNSSVWGNANCVYRTYDVLTSINKKGYTMLLMEVPQFYCAAGFSGSPILNGNCDFLAVYHGVDDESQFGYCISLDDVRHFLTTALDNVFGECLWQEAREKITRDAP